MPVISRDVSTREGGGKVLYGEAAPRSPTPLPFYIPFFTGMVPLSHTFCWQKTPFHVPSLVLLIIFKGNVFEISLNHKTRKFSRPSFSPPLNTSVFPWGVFSLQSEITDFLTFSYTWNLTKAPHSGEPPRKDHYREYTPPQPLGRLTAGIHQAMVSILCAQPLGEQNKETNNKRALSDAQTVIYPSYIDNFSSILCRYSSN